MSKRKDMKIRLIDGLIKKILHKSTFLNHLKVLEKILTLKLIFQIKKTDLKNIAHIDTFQTLHYKQT